MIHLKGPEGPIELNPVDGPMGWEWNGVSARPVSEDVIEVSWGGRTLRAHVAVEGDRAWVNLDGHVLVFDALLGPTNASMEGASPHPCRASFSTSMLRRAIRSNKASRSWSSKP